MPQIAATAPPVSLRTEGQSDLLATDWIGEEGCVSIRAPGRRPERLDPVAGTVTFKDAFQSALRPEGRSDHDAWPRSGSGSTVSIRAPARRPERPGGRMGGKIMASCFNPRSGPKAGATELSDQWLGWVQVSIRAPARRPERPRPRLASTPQRFCTAFPPNEQGSRGCRQFRCQRTKEIQPQQGVVTSANPSRPPRH